jgi:hypothetical protein
MIPGIRLLPLSRGYATKRPASRLKPTISLDHVCRKSIISEAICCFNIELTVTKYSFSKEQKHWLYTEQFGDIPGALPTLRQELSLANMPAMSLSDIATSQIS